LRVVTLDRHVITHEKTGRDLIRLACPVANVFRVQSPLIKDKEKVVEITSAPLRVSPVGIMGIRFVC
jgi:hypothetical protein